MDTNLGKVVLVKDIRPDVTEFPSGFSINYTSFPNGLVEFNGKLYFSADNGEVGNELYVSDGTAVGTKLVVDLNPGENEDGFSYDSDPYNFAEFNDKLYFTANDEQTGRELYVTDGTARGTKLLVDLDPGEDKYGAKSSYPDNFAEFNDKLYFSASDEQTGRELYVTDGNAKGTKLLVDLNPGEDKYGAKSSYPDNFIEFNDKLYFTANSAESYFGLYVSDGTAQGTELLVDLFSEGTLQADNFVEFNGKLYFSASTSENGYELYVSDGTAEGTQLVADIYPGKHSSDDFPNSSDPSDLTVVGDELFFSADNGETGTELFKLTVGSEGEDILQVSAGDDLAGF
jgi:ELWxxDGT repeat protein